MVQWCIRLEFALSLLHRSCDVFIASTPIFASLLIGSVCWKAIHKRFPWSGSTSLPGALAAGGAVLQSLTWLGALFSVALTWITQFGVLLIGVIVFALLVYAPPAVRARFPLIHSPLTRAAGLGGLVLGFFLAGSAIPASVPSDVTAYHLPVSAWFGQGDAWPALPNHTWNAQWPLASSLWSSFVTGHLPITDRLVAWSAQTIAFGVWTAALVFWTAAFLLRRERGGRFLAALISVSLLIGAYSGYQQRIGFIDYRLGFFAAALIGTLLPIHASLRTFPLAIALASTVSEFRPQGFLLGVALLLSWAGLFSESGVSFEHVSRKPARGAAGAMPALLLWYAVALALFSKWWALNWLRWGTPAPPMLARLLNLRQTEKYADELFRYLWTRNPVKGLKLAFLGSPDTLLTTILMWVLVLLSVASLRGSGRGLNGSAKGGPPFLRRVSRSASFLAPVGAIAFIAIEVPTEAARMIPPMIPACALLCLYGTQRALGGSAARSAIVFSVLFAILGLASAPAPGARAHATRDYPTASSIYFSQIEGQLERLRDQRPLIFDNWVAFLPRGVKQMGVTYGPWASFPAKPLRTMEAWTEWLRANGVGTVVVQEGKLLKSTWEWTQARTETPDFTVLDRWIETCPDKRQVGQWIACPVPPVSPVESPKTR
jgi:hypothetical protein